MTIYPLSGASWPAKQQSSAAAPLEVAQGCGRRRETQTHSGSPRQWQLRKAAPSLPVMDADDYWSDASLSLPHLPSTLPQAADQLGSRVTIAKYSRSSQSEEIPHYVPAQCPQYTQKSSTAQVVTKKAARSCSFPPPLESPAVCEGRYHHLQSLDKVCFTSVRSHGRLILIETPITTPRRHLHTERRDGRLLLRLYEERSATEDERPVGVEGEEDEQDSTAERATPLSPCAPLKASREGEVAMAKKANNYPWAEGDALISTDEFSASPYPLNLQVKNGRSHGVADFLHKSLTRVRPLHVLTVWQS